MNQLLNIDEIIGENKRQENDKLHIFESVLEQCHKLIQRHNKDRIRDMTYTVPAFIFGKPKYNVDILRNYLIWHLQDNGLYVEIIDRYHLYISWKETDINLEKYMNRKTQIENQHKSLYMIDQGPSYSGVTVGGEDRSRFEMMKYRQDRQREIQEERQKRFDIQKSRFQSPHLMPSGPRLGSGLGLGL
jgi:hypothetical protein